MPLHPSAIAAWTEWMQSWFASHWMPEDLPGLNVVIGLYDQVLDYLREPLIEKEYVTAKGETRTTWVVKPNPTGELRQMMDNYGISPKGQQDRRWVQAKAGDQPETSDTADTAAPSPYAGLRVVG